MRPVALAHAVRVKLPPGFVGDPSATPTCPLSLFLKRRGNIDECPSDSVVGVADSSYYARNIIGAITETNPVNNLEPQPGEPARLGWYVPLTEFPLYIDTSLRSGGDYGVTSTTPNITQDVAFVSSNVTLWGVPGAASHDKARNWNCLETSRGITPAEVLNNAFSLCTPLGVTHPPPFFDMPTSCTGPLQTSVEVDSWQDEGSFASLASEPVPGLTGCNQMQFVPQIKVTPDGTQASKPTGLDVDVHVPQEGQLNSEGNAQSNIKGIEVTLPEGVILNPSAADGLAACSGNVGAGLEGHLGAPGDQIGYEGFKALASEPGVSAPTFTPYIPESVDALANGFGEALDPGVNFCPDASKIATVKIKTPLLPNPLEGAVYLASPQNFNVFPAENPFGTHVAMYLVAEDPVSGSLVKLPGKVELGGAPGVEGLAQGQIRSIFEDNPQLPFEDAEVHFFGGERAPLAMPARCGTYTTTAAYTPWDGGSQARSSSSFQITSGPNGSPCVYPGQALAFSPSLRGGALNINAGAFSPFTATFSRSSGEQNMQSIQAKLPPGLLALLPGVELCPEPQANDGTCGPNSLIGEATISVGVGGEPFTVSGGKFYLTGPYNGTGACNVIEPGCAPFGITFGIPRRRARSSCSRAVR